ncbi:hypothetical protein F8568_035430 [Actinomadura sp. LD22]|uniref:LLM class flavin-dependent oxidoreductase n=1 Tax=Actinomadura physcomitrii TaxID=2650748 RepID=A0A6I4MTD8_9ACTN|nr:hypothetical protein [Actinomadura physcomitrii]MWA05566.1 hypothetical protein [Actinomadura physcomitrii]
MRVVERARRALGPVGTYVPVPFTRWIPIDEQRKAVRRLEAAGRDFGRPLETMRAYLDAMAEPPPMPGPDAAYPRVIGANGPKMLGLAADTADGAFPANQPPEFTAETRRTLGPDELLVVGTAHNADDEPATAAEVRAHLAAGADHVTLFPATGDDFTADVDRLVHLAPALLR